MSGKKLLALLYNEENLKLGEGGFGVVKCYTNRKTGQRVAVKKMSHANPEPLQNEIDTLKKLAHENIVELLDTVLDTHFTYLILELLSGGQLYDTIVLQHHYTEASVSNYIKQILSGINYCHQQNIVHADIKPENIIFAKSGDDRLKIIDFGISFVDSKSDVYGCGTYKAPEIVNRIQKQTYGKPIDIWACGLILFTLLCGELPFAETDKHDQEQFFERARNRITFPFTTEKGFGQAPKDLITRMLCVDAGQRITAKDVLNDPWICDANLPNTHLMRTMMNLEGFNERRNRRAQARG